MTHESGGKKGYPMSELCMLEVVQWPTGQRANAPQTGMFRTGRDVTGRVNEIDMFATIPEGF